jgi:hypothetical protein
MTIPSGGDSGAARSAAVVVHNSGSVDLTGAGPAPVAIGVQWLHDGEVAGDWVRLSLPCSIHAQDTRSVVIELPRHADAIRRAQVTLFQKREGHWTSLQPGALLRIALPLPPGPEILASGFELP